MNTISLYRRRLIPDECVSLHDDIILYMDEEVLVTSWKTLHPKKDFDHGFSCYYLKEGCKISCFYHADNTLLYYYCDIISSEYDQHSGRLTVTDLLADVIVYPDGFVKICDLDELVSAHDRGLISTDLLKTSIGSLHRLLEMIYAGKLKDLLSPIEQFGR